MPDRAGASKEPSTARIGDLDIHDVTFREAVDLVWERVEAATNGVVCTPNADYVVRARRDEQFRAAIMSADLRVPDGMGIVYASRIAGRPISTTVTGRLLLPELARRASTRGVAIALFGALPGVAGRAAKRLTSANPGLTVAAAISPPAGFTIGSAEDDAATAALQTAQPRMIFVGLGAPKQEIWMQTHRGDFEIAVLIGVGAALDIVAGRFREAPPWMTRVGLEWLFRLAQEPRRLGRRYLIDDPWILWWAIKTRFRTTLDAIRRGRET